MVQANTFELQLVLQNGSYFSYQNLSQYLCIAFDKCDNWHASKSVLWRNMNPLWDAFFYENSDCDFHGGHYHQFPGKQGDNGHTFSTPRAIGSIRARPTKGQNLYAQGEPVRECLQLHHPAKRAEAELLSNETTSGSVGNGTGWTSLGSHEDGDISSNWFEPTASGDNEMASGSGEEEYKFYADVFMNG